MNEDEKKGSALTAEEIERPGQVDAAFAALYLRAANILFVGTFFAKAAARIFLDQGMTTEEAGEKVVELIRLAREEINQYRLESYDRIADEVFDQVVGDLTDDAADKKGDRTD